MHARSLAPPALPTLLFLLAVAACDGGAVEPKEPVGPPQSGIAVQLRVSEPALAQALGWAGGAVPGAEVSFWSSHLPDDTDISPYNTAAVVRVTGDAAGTADLGERGAGSYTLRAQRVLSAAERASLAQTAWRDVVGVAGLVNLSVRDDGTAGVANPGAAAPVTGAAVQAVPMRQGGLVIAQWSMGYPRAFNGQYHGGKHLTIYNNGEATEYLDGMIVGTANNYWQQDWPLRPCAQSARYREDETGVWTRDAARFPGSGQQYPVPPGGVVLVAVDAIDHRGQTHDPLFDLRGADFEFFGSTDVDNPAVPNMITLDDFGDTSGRGFMAKLTDVTVLWAPQDWASLSREDDFFDGAPWTRLPAAGHRDAISSRGLINHVNLSYCDPVLPRIFDRQIARLETDDLSPERAVYRRVALTLPDGRVVLQNTRTSVLDLVVAPADPEAAPVWMRAP